MVNELYKNIPEYYDTMYLDGYSPYEIYAAHQKLMMKMIAKRQAEAKGKEDIEKEITDIIDNLLDGFKK